MGEKMENILEIIMIISTLIYSYLLLHCKRSGFIFGIISAGMMGYILISTGVFVQAILNFIYAIMYIYSYFNWGKENAPNISRITTRGLIVSVVSMLTFTLLIGYTFSVIGESHPYIDSFSAACSITAVFLLSRKVVEHAYIFVLSNIASIFICYASYDHITIITFLLYMVFNVMRGYMWQKELNKESKTA